MNSKELGLKVASAIFTLVAAVHLLRIALGWSVMVGGYGVPRWMSVGAAVGGAALGAWLGKLAWVRRPGAPTEPMV